MGGRGRGVWGRGQSKNNVVGEWTVERQSAAWVHNTCS